jgi:hypothetical protein
MNAIQKLLSGLKNVLEKSMKRIEGFSHGFTELHTKLDADTLPDFAIYHRQNETRS